MPADAYVCAGFAVVAVCPSPKSQAYEATVPSPSDEPEPSSEQARFVQAIVNEAAGATLAGATVTVCMTESVAPSSSVTVRVTSNEPLAAYVCVAVAPVAVPVSPKDQA